jgi:hypothetical protein
MSVTEPQPAVPNPKLRWYQFSLRSLIKFVTRCAILCVVGASLALVPSWVMRQADIADAIKELGGSVRWSQPSGPVWLRSLLGDEFFEHVESANLDHTQITDADMEKLVRLKGLSRLEELSLAQTQITDECLTKLQQALPNCKITR